jgi:hypothetical protein
MLVAGIFLQAYLAYAVRSWRRAGLITEDYWQTAKKLWLMVPTIWAGPSLVLFLLEPWLWRLSDFLDATLPK